MALAISSTPVAAAAVRARGGDVARRARSHLGAGEVVSLPRPLGFRSPSAGRQAGVRREGSFVVRAGEGIEELDKVWVPLAQAIAPGAPRLIAVAVSRETGEMADESGGEVPVVAPPWRPPVSSAASLPSTTPSP